MSKKFLACTSILLCSTAIAAPPTYPRKDPKKYTEPELLFIAKHTTAKTRLAALKGLAQKLDARSHIQIRSWANAWKNAPTKTLPTLKDPVVAPLPVYGISTKPLTPKQKKIIIALFSPPKGPKHTVNEKGPKHTVNEICKSSKVAMLFVPKCANSPNAKVAQQLTQKSCSHVNSKVLTTTCVGLLMSNINWNNLNPANLKHVNWGQLNPANWKI